MAVAMVGGMLWCAGVVPGEMARAESAEQVQNAVPSIDEALVVDCLLPGQIRRLGSQAIFLTARRPVKITVRDCEIRGGDFDRTNYRGALEVLLASAQGGDPVAQAYVGEIFERGLGVPPDYTAAAEWYRRAAEQGHCRAAVKLGALYERGVGVPHDPEQAVKWYRRAAPSPPDPPSPMASGRVCE